jgi:hypothetical protein
MTWKTRKVWHQTSAAGSGYWVEERYWVADAPRVAMAVRTADPRKTAAQKAAEAARDERARKQARAAAAAAAKRRVWAHIGELSSKVLKDMGPLTTKSGVGSSVLAGKTLKNGFWVPDTTLPGQAQKRASGTEPGGRYAIKPGEKDIRPSGGFDNSFNVMMAKEKAAKAKASASKKHADKLAHVKVMEDVLTMARKGQTSSRGHKLNADYVGAVWTEYMAHEKHVREVYEAQSGRLDKLMTHGKDGKWYYKSAAAQAQGRKIVNNSEFKYASAEMERLHFKHKTKSGYEGDFQKIGRQVMNMAEDQRQFTRTQAYEQYMSGATGPVDYFNRKESWEKYGKWAYDASADDIKPGETSYKFVKDPKTGNVKRVKRTVEEEYEYRKGQDKKHQQEQIDLAKAEYAKAQKEYANDANMRMQVPKSVMGTDEDHLLLADAAKSVGIDPKRGIANKFQLDKTVEAAMAVWSERHKEDWVHSKFDDPKKRPKFLQAWDAEQKRLYAIFGKEPTPDYDKTMIPFAKPLMQVFSTAAALPPMLARLEALSGGGFATGPNYGDGKNTSKVFGVEPTLEQAPPEIQKKMDAIFAEAMRSDSKGVRAAAYQKRGLFYDAWLKTAEGKKWFNDQWAENRQRSLEEDYAFEEKLRAGDKMGVDPKGLLDRLGNWADAVTEYGSEPFSNPMLSLASGFFTDPTAAFPLNFMKWGSRLEHIREVTAGMSKIKKFGVGVLEFQKVTEEQLEAGKQLARLKGIAAGSPEAKKMTEQFLQELAGISMGKDRAKKTRKLFIKYGIDPDARDGKLLLNTAQMAMVKGMAEAGGIDYRDVARRAQELEGAIIADEAKAAKEALSPSLAAAEAKQVATDAAKAEADKTARETLHLQYETRLEPLAERAHNQPLMVHVPTEITVSHESLRPLSRQVDNVFAEVDQVKISTAAAEGGASRPKVGQAAADLAQHITGNRDVFHAGGYQFAPGAYTDDLLASDEYKAAIKALEGTEDEPFVLVRGHTPEQMALRAEQETAMAQARAFLHQASAESIAARARDEQSIGRQGGSLVDGRIPWATPKKKGVRAGIAFAIAGGAKSSKQYIVRNVDLLVGLMGSKTPVEELANWELRREFEDLKRELTSAGALRRSQKEAGENAVQAAKNEAKYVETKNKIAGKGVFRKTSDLTVDLYSKKGIIVDGGELEHIRAGMVDGFIPLGDEMVRAYERNGEYMNTAALGDYYETFSLLPEVRLGGAGVETEVMENIMKPEWRANLTIDGFNRWWASSGLFNDGTRAISPVEFRANGMHVFALFHMMLLDAENTAAEMSRLRKAFEQKKITRERMIAEASEITSREQDAYARLYEFSGEVRKMLVEDPDNPYALMWEVMEARSGVIWADSFAEVEGAFMRGVIEGNPALHPSLAMGMIAYGPIARTLPISHGFTGHLRNLATSSHILVQASPPNWTDDKVLGVMLDIAGKRITQKMRMVKSIQIAHYIASRYGSVERRRIFKVATQDYAISAAYRFAQEEPSMAMSMNEVRHRWIDAGVDETLAAIEGTSRGGTRADAVAYRQRAWDQMFNGKLQPGKMRREYDDELRGIFEEMYWAGDITHDNRGLHTQMFLMKMADPAFQRGDSWVHYAESYFDHMVVAGGGDDARSLMGVMFESELYRDGWDAFEAGGDQFAAGGKVAKQRASTAFFQRAGMLTESMIERARAQGLERGEVSADYSIEAVERQIADDDLAITETTLTDKQARMAAGEPVKMYDAATIDNLAVKAQEASADLAGVTRDQRRLETGHTVLDEAYSELRRLAEKRTDEEERVAIGRKQAARAREREPEEVRVARSLLSDAHEKLAGLRKGADLAAQNRLQVTAEVSRLRDLKARAKRLESGHWKPSGQVPNEEAPKHLADSLDIHDASDVSSELRRVREQIGDQVQAVRDARADLDAALEKRRQLPQAEQAVKDAEAAVDAALIDTAKYTSLEKAQLAVEELKEIDKARTEGVFAVGRAKRAVAAAEEALAQLMGAPYASSAERLAGENALRDAKLALGKAQAELAQFPSAGEFFDRTKAATARLAAEESEAARYLDVMKDPDSLKEARAAHEAAKERVRVLEKRAAWERRVDERLQIARDALDHLTGVGKEPEFVPDGARRFGEGTASEVAAARKRVANLEAMAERALTDERSAGRVLRTATAKPSGARMKNYFMEFRGIRSGRAKLSDDGSKVIWAKKGETFGAPDDVGEALEAYLHSDALPEDARVWMNIALRNQEVRKRLNSLMFSLMQRTRDINSVSEEVGAQMMEIVAVVKGGEGGDAWLKQWAETYYDDLMQTRLIDYLVHEDWFTMRRAADLREASRLAPLRREMVRVGEEVKALKGSILSALPTKVAEEFEQAFKDAVAKAHARNMEPPKKVFPKELRERMKAGEFGREVKKMEAALTEREREAKRLDVAHREEILDKASREAGVSPMAAYQDEVRDKVRKLEAKLKELTTAQNKARFAGADPNAAENLLAGARAKLTSQLTAEGRARRASIRKTVNDLVLAKEELQDVESDVAYLMGRREEGERYIYGPKLAELDMNKIDGALPHKPSPDELSPQRVGVSHKALEILQQMSEDDWLARELEKVRHQITVAPRGKGSNRQALVARRRMIQRVQKVIEVEKSAKPGTYVTPRNRASYISTAKSVLGARAKASYAAKRIAPFVFSVAGAETEQGRALNVMLRRAKVNRGNGSRVRRVGDVSATYVSHGVAIEDHFGVSLTTDLLKDSGFPEDLLADLTATEFIVNLDEFSRSLKNPEFRRFVGRFVRRMDESLKEITGDKTYTIEQWMEDRLLQRSDHFDSRLFEKIDGEISDAKSRVLSGGKKRTRRTDLVRGAGPEPGPVGDPLFEMVDSDLAAVVAKAKAAAKYGVDVHSYNEARKVLRRAYLMKKYAAEFSHKADAAALAILHGEGLMPNDKKWSTRYSEEYEKAFHALRDEAAGEEAVKMLEQLAQDEMMGAPLRELIEEFERRYGVDKEVKGFEPAPISEYQRRTLEEAVKTHLGVTDLDDVAQMAEGLGRHGQKPPMENREAMKKWLVQYGFWSPRTAADIESGKKSWNIFEETRFYKDNWGVAPKWADSDLIEEGGLYHEMLHDEELRAETNLEWGLFDRNMLARFHSATMSQAERVRFLVEGSAKYGVKAKRDVPLERRFVMERYGRLAVDDGGNLIAFPNLMTPEELKTYMLARTAKGLAVPSGVFQTPEEMDIFHQLLAKHMGKYIDEMVMLGRTVEYEDVLTVSARIVTDMLDNPLWMERNRDYIGKFIRGQAALRRSFIFTQLAFMTTNVLDSGIKAAWARFKLRSFMNGKVYEHAMDYTLQDYGMKPHGALLRDEEIVGTHRIMASRKMPMKYRLYNGKVIEETKDQMRLRKALAVAQGIGEMPLQMSGAAEDFMKIRLAREMYGGTYELGLAKLGDEALADAWARKFIGETIGKMWPSSGNGPYEQLFNQISPFFSYQAKNRLIFMNEMINHPYLFNFFNRIGDIMQLHNEQQHPGQGELDPSEARLFELPWAPGVFIDIGAWSDMQRGIKTLYDLTDEKTAPSALKLGSQFVRLVGAGDQNMALGILNAFHIGFRKEWQQQEDGTWTQIEVPWEAPWGGEANWMNAFWPIEAASKWAKAVEGKMTVSAVTLAAYQTMFFGGVKQHDRAAGMNSFYWALKDTDPVAANEWLNTTPDGFALRMSWLDKTPGKTYEWYTPETIKRLISPPEAADTNEWFHSKDELFQTSVKVALDELDKIKHKWNNILWELTPGTAEFARAKLDAANERFRFTAAHPELYEFYAFSATPEEWAQQYDDWTTDDMVDTYFNIEQPDKAKYKTDAAYQKAMDAWRDQRRQFLKDHPKVEERVGSARTSVEAIWKDTEQHWFDVLDRVGRRNVALEAARQSNDFKLSDQLWLANETDYKQLDIHEVVSYFNPETDYQPLLQSANYKDRQGPLQFRKGPFGQTLLPKVRILPSFDEWRYDRANEADKAKMRRDRRYGEGMKTVIDKAKASGNFGRTFVDSMKGDKWLLDEYFRRNPGKREKWAASDEYFRQISKYGLLAKAGKFSEAGAYFDSLPKWVQDRYYNAHPERRQSRADRQQTLQYIGLMKRWTNYYKHRDYAGGAAFFEKLPKWAKDRYYQKHPDGFGRGTKKSSPYSRAMGKWVKLLDAGDKEGAKKWFDSMPAAYRERYYKGHPEARLRDDVKRSGQLGEYFAANDAARAQYLKDNPEFARWLHKQGDKEQTRKMLITAAYQALPADNQWLKRMFREKYPEVFSQEAKGAGSLKKTYRFLAEHPEMQPAFERWLEGVMASFAEEQKHHLARPKPVVSDHSRVAQHGTRPRRMTPGQSAAWVRLHQTS